MIQELGGKCAKCKTVEHLELDCIEPQGHAHHKLMDQTMRMAFYRRQKEANNLQVLCKRDNSLKGNTTDRGINEPDPF